MIGMFIALAVLLGLGGTAVVADNAQPGDALFGIDKAVEKIRINIARKENKNELRIKFAEERVKELEELASDDAVDNDDNDIDNAEESDDLDDDTESPSDEKKELTDEQKERILIGINDALNLLTELEGDQTIDLVRLEALKTVLNSYLANLPENAKIEINDERLKIKFGNETEDELNDSGKSNNKKIKIEGETDGGRIRIEIKNGSIEIKTKLDNDDDDEDDEGDDEDDEENENDDDNDNEGLEDIEAKIYSDKTIVEIEINDEETTFVTDANTRAAIIAIILEKFPELTQSEVESALKIENENDNFDGEDKDKEDDSDSDDEDENDNSGSGEESED